MTDSAGELKVQIELDLDAAKAAADQRQAVQVIQAIHVAGAKAAETAWEKALEAKTEAAAPAAEAVAPAAAAPAQEQAAAQSAERVKTVWEEAAESIAKKQKAAQQAAAEELLEMKVDPSRVGDPVAHLKQIRDREEEAKEKAEELEEQMKEFGDRTKEAGVTVRDSILGALGAAGAALLGFTHHVFESSIAIDRQARSLGVSTDELQRMQYIAGQAGLESNDLGEAMGALAQKAAEAAHEAGGARDLFKDLDMTFRDASGSVLPTNQLLAEAADTLARIPAGTERTAAAIQIFGEKGRLLLPVLERGREGLEQLGAEFDELGGGIDQDTIASMRRLNESWERAKVRALEFAMPIVNRILPALERMGTQFQSVADDIEELNESSTSLRATIIGVGIAGTIAGGALMVSFAPEIAMFTAVAGAAALLGLALDDIIVTVDGGDSVIRRFTDGLLGVGATAAGVRTAQVAWLELYAVVDRIDAAFLRVAAAGERGVARIAHSIKDSAADALEAMSEVARAVGIDVTGTALDPASLVRRRMDLAHTIQENGMHSYGLEERARQNDRDAAVYGIGAEMVGGGSVAASPSMIAAGMVPGLPVSANVTQRAQVQFNGVIDPSSQAFKTAVGQIVTEAMDTAAKSTLEGVSKSGGRRRG